MRSPPDSEGGQGSATQVGMAVLDRHLRLRHCDSSWLHLMDVSSGDDVLGKRLVEFLPGMAAVIRSAMPRLSTGEPLYLEELPRQTDGGVFHRDMILIRMMPMGERDGVEGFLHLVVDVERRAATRETLERSVVGYRRELSALRDVMSVAAESLELKVVLRRILDHVLRMMKSRMGAIHLFDEEHSTLRLAAVRGVRTSELEEIRDVPGPFDLSTWPTEGSASFVVPEIAGPLRRSMTAEGRRKPPAYVGMPVRSRGESMGLISVVGRRGRRFDEGDVALLSSIADQIGVVVENARLHRQAEQLAVVRERERLARELHDSVTQSLYSLTLLAEASQRLLGSGELERAAEYTGRLGEIAQQALKEMRLLVYQLRPLVLKRVGLVGALQQRLDAVEKRAGVDARLLVEGTVELLAPIEEGLYRIAQEALNNALKHAAPRSVVLTIDAEPGRAVLEVEDDGRGFDPEAVSDKGGMGLTSMRERAERLGGSLSLVSSPGEGTRVRVEVEVGR